MTKLVLCSGKVYYDIAGHEERARRRSTSRSRAWRCSTRSRRSELRELMDSYPNLERVVWVQEEPRNMGARAFMRRRMAAILPEHLHYYYVGRQLRAAQSEGYTAAHRKEQARIVRVALDLEDDMLEPDASAERPLAVDGRPPGPSWGSRPWPPLRPRRPPPASRSSWRRRRVRGPPRWTPRPTCSGSARAARVAWPQP